jgi:glutaconate CoA-transferase subunit B
MVGDVQAATGWDLRVAADLERTLPPTEEEVLVLRELETARPGVGAR